MKNQIMAIVALAALSSSAAIRLQRGGYYEHDDFEDASVKREGSPEIVQRLVSSGLLTNTGTGSYSTGKAVRIKEAGINVPTAADLYFESGMRIYEFGENARLELNFFSGECKPNRGFAATLVRKGGNVAVTVAEDGRLLGELEVPVAVLPAEFSFSASTSGKFTAVASSLVDSSLRETSGDCAVFTGFPPNVREIWTLLPVRADAEAKLVVDEYFFAPSRAIEGGAIPFAIEREPTFDPKAAGWKLVFEDEFEGDSVDWTNKWFMPYYDARAEIRKSTYALTDGQGHLKLKIDYVDPNEDLGEVLVSGNENPDPTKKRLGSISLYTKEAYGYGYYEAKLKFTTQNGFWSAFWMYGDSNCNPFLDGFEIDGYEDYYTRWKTPDGKPGRTNDHNLHIRTGLGQSKSWNYNSELPGDFDAWHVMGIKWTPFEISYYMDGKLLKSKKKVGHSPWDTVTFDSFNHCACTSPTHAVLSGCIMKAQWNKTWQDLTGCEFPTYFQVDYVRVWEMPRDPATLPEVKWTAATEQASALAPTGSVIRLAAEVRPAASGAKLRAVHLFDNGFYMGTRTEPPYEFSFELSDEALMKTGYKRPGRQKQIIELNGMPHVFHVFAQDESGAVGRTAEPLVRFPVFGESKPYQGTAAKLPGSLSPAKFDEGGIPVGYYKHKQSVEKLRQDLSPRPSFEFRGNEFASCSADGAALDFLMTCEWYNYTVDIAETRAYTITFPYGTPGHGINELQFYLDGRKLGAAKLEYHDGISFRRDRVATVSFTLPKGRHQLKLMPVGPLAIGTLEIR